MAIGLLATAVNFAQLGQNIVAFFTGFSVLFAIEIILFFGMIFFVSKVLRDNDATKLMCLYWLILLAGGAMHIFDGEIMTKSIFLLYVILLSVLMLIATFSKRASERRSSSCSA